MPGVLYTIKMSLYSNDSAPKLLAMATSETVQSGLRVSALENAKLNMEDNTWQLRASDRLHAVVTCKVLMRSASGVTRAGVVLWSWLEEVELVTRWICGFVKACILFKLVTREMLFKMLFEAWIFPNFAHETWSELLSTYSCLESELPFDVLR